MKVIAAKVFPEPVAIWIKVLGRFSLKDFSRLFIALIWQSLNLCVCRAGRSCSLFLNDLPCFNQSLKVSGRWKLKTSLDLGLGSVKSVNLVTSPVLRYTNGKGSFLRCLRVAKEYPSV